MSKLIRSLTAVAVFGALAACTDSPLEVENTNNPDTQRALKSPADVEKLIADSYNLWFVGTHGNVTPGIYAQMSDAAFEHSAMAANFGMVERSAMPRLAINNNSADTYAAEYFELWKDNNSALVSAALGLQRYADPAFTLGDADDDARAKAFAYLVLGLAHGSIAVTYDSGSVIDPANFSANATPPLVGYDSVMNAALNFLDKAIETSEGASFTLPETWINGNAMSADELAALAHTYKAKYRAQVARTKAERDAVDWSAVLADANAGISSTLEITMDDNIWYLLYSYYHSFFGAWNQMNYMFLGMADQSGRYQTWFNSADYMSRQPFVLVTADRRFPSGTTATEQAANPGLYLAYKGNSGGHVRAERGQWRWSFYEDERYTGFYETYQGPYPVVTTAEMDLLEAEALIRLNRVSEALPLVNATRVANGQLPAVTGAGAVPGGTACVPKLPSGQCGDLFEALKWEKRLETWGTGFGSWFLDARGWNDLPKGTALSWPVPARELQVRQLLIYTTGGANPQSQTDTPTYPYPGT